MGIREELLVQAISSFPTMFSKGFFPRPVKGVIVWEWVYLFTVSCIIYQMTKTRVVPFESIKFCKRDLAMKD